MPITLDDLRQRVSRLTAPVSEAAPAGTLLASDERLHYIRDQVALLETTQGTEPNWQQIVTQGSEILTQVSKDYLIAVYVAFGFYKTKGIGGLLDGIMLLTELQETYWETMFPEASRVRRRANSLAWFISKVEPLIVTTNINRLDRSEVMALKEVCDALIASTRTRYESNAPATSPLKDAVNRLVASLPPEAPPPPPPSATPEVYVPETAPAQPEVYYPEESTYVASSDGGGGGGVGDLVSIEAAPEWFGSVGDSLARAAGVLRAANRQDPNAYRVLRDGIWMRFLTPPLDEQGALFGEAPDAATREELTTLVASEAWDEVVERAETLAVGHPLWLDLQRLVSEAMGALGDEWELARRAVDVGTAAFLRRHPEALDWKYADGSPTSDESTRRWITRALGAPKPNMLGAMPKDVLQSTVQDAQGLLDGGDPIAALTLLQRRVAGSATPIARFRARLAMARLASQAGFTSLARALFAQLDQESSDHRLDRWEPSLAAECLEGYVVALRASAEATGEMPAALPTLFDRLSLIDPIAAARIGG